MTPADPAQRDRALAKAQWTRTQRAELKRKCKSREVDAFRCLRGADPVWEPIVAPMRLDRFLLVIPGVGERTADELLAEFALSGDWQLCALTFERRAELADALALVLAGEPLPPAQRPAA